MGNLAAWAVSTNDLPQIVNATDNSFAAARWINGRKNAAVLYKSVVVSITVVVKSKNLSQIVDAGGDSVDAARSINGGVDAPIV